MITYLNLGRMGRFGNALFEIAGTIGVATKNGHPFAFPLFINHDAKERFGSTEDIEVYKHFVNPLPLVPEGLPWESLNYHWDYRDYWLPPTGNYNLNAHFQSEKYFEHCMEMVRHYFRMVDEPEQNEYVAIHYRAGDYDADSNGYHPRCSREYYEAAMALFPGEKFMFFSDDLNEAMRLFPGELASTGTYIDDFKLMKRCKSFICANSSFSHMAALLGEHPDKKIVMPRRWFGAVAGIDMEGQYPRNAIIL